MSGHRGQMICFFAGVIWVVWFVCFFVGGGLLVSRFCFVFSFSLVDHLFLVVFFLIHTYHPNASLVGKDHDA